MAKITILKEVSLKKQMVMDLNDWNNSLYIDRETKKIHGSLIYKHRDDTFEERMSSIKASLDYINREAKMIYDWVCKKCNIITSVERKVSEIDNVTKCSSCGSEYTERIISKTNFSLKGGGWYKDAYQKGDKND